MLLLSIIVAKGVEKMEKENKPYQFPQEMPERERKYDKGVIIDVVENEINPHNTEQSTHEHSMWEYRGNKSEH